MAEIRNGKADPDNMLHFAEFQNNKMMRQGSWLASKDSPTRHEIKGII